MNQKYLNKLEYFVILDKLSNYCHTTSGKDICQNLIPACSKQEVLALLNETDEAVRFVFQRKNPPLSFLPDISYCIKLLQSNGVLSIKSLLDLNHILKLSYDLKNYFLEDLEDEQIFPILSSYFSSLYTNPKIWETIQKAIIDENTLADHASSKLLSIRKEKRKLEDSIKEKLNSFIHSSTYAKYLQENIITIRNDRYVIPVKEEYRGMIKGFVHDASASGSTIFIEPMAIFELNNELNLLRSEELIEINKILANLSSLFYPYIQELESNITIISQLDFIFAKANFAIEMDGISPKINDEKILNLIDARHPLLDQKVAVPISIHLGKDFKTLVITGPNTGGKTVTLKTVGLLTLMACSGLFIPAKEQSSIYVFDQVFADIGDEQSISESLSTFSSHMSNIIEILNGSSMDSLVLLDELGSGTDPIEGSNLAISILEKFYQKGILTIATTHYPEVKNYVLITEAFENASQRI